MSSTYSVYYILLSDGVEYVGISGNLDQRLKAHFSNANTSPSVVFRYRKQNPGVEIVRVEVLYSGLAECEARQKEREEISKLKRPLNQKYKGLVHKTTVPLDDELFFSLKALAASGEYETFTEAVRTVLRAGIKSLGKEEQDA